MNLGNIKLDIEKRQAMKSKLKQAVIVQAYGLPTLTRNQQIGEIMLQGDNGFYFIRKEERGIWYAEYFGTKGLKSCYFHTGKAHTIQSCKERLVAQRDSEGFII